MKRYLLYLYSGILFLFLLSGCSQKRYSNNKMRPYNVLGRHYIPTYVNVGSGMKGLASWYGPNFHGKLTCNGEIYNMYQRTAAHKTWPMDTMVRVKNLENGRSTVVRINDRGPFVSGRIIDCSYVAGKELGLDKMGIAKVELEVIGIKGKINSKSRKSRKPQGVSKQHENRISPSDYGIQIGAFSSYDAAKHVVYTTTQKYTQYTSRIKEYHTISGDIVYRVILYGFKSREDVLTFKENNLLTGQIYSKKIG